MDRISTREKYNTKKKHQSKDARHFGVIDDRWHDIYDGIGIAKSWAMHRNERSMAWRENGNKRQNSRNLD